MKKFINGGLFLFFFLMLVLPASFQVPRGVILLGLLLFSLRDYALKRFKIYTPILNISIINVGCSVLFFFNGYANQNPGAVAVTTVFIFWPILYLYFIGFNVEKEQIYPLLKCLFYGGITSMIFIAALILWTLGFIPFDLSLIAKAQDFSVYWGDSVEINAINLATIMYVLVFSLSFLIFPKDYNYKKIVSKKVVVFTLLLAFIIVLLSARRGFWVVAIVAPVYIYIVYRLAGVKIRLKKYIIPIFAFLMLGLLSLTIFSLNNENFITEFSSSFEFDNPQVESNYLRLEQYNALVKGWEKSPIIGVGLGGAAEGSVRDTESPWAYELSYLALLFHTGIIGVLVYSMSVLWIIYKAIKLARMNKLYATILLPQITALIAFLLINASNPYLGKFDYLWTIFLPIASINAIMISSTKTPEKINNG
ncbi:hypothetical protein DHW03_11610 [Pedobacter yonginense]|uniref:O-antigen ligase-related domain-containing protein n=1 Tax=Pedobacter yonginense TaxID=651869 RepID=A0A317EQM1_9SPHI|nr:O-antigen ligase family protein [Pedobacter yonginense]PWS28189.1 hypothetical protein DHW03_11610 [Pedobacter yonginense]